MANNPKYAVIAEYFHYPRKGVYMQCSNCGRLIMPQDKYYQIHGQLPKVEVLKKVECIVCTDCFRNFEKKYPDEMTFPGARDFEIIAYLVFEENLKRRNDTKKSATWSFLLDENNFYKHICNNSPF